MRGRPPLGSVEACTAGRLRCKETLHVHEVVMQVVSDFRFKTGIFRTKLTAKLSTKLSSKMTEAVMTVACVVGVLSDR